MLDSSPQVATRQHPVSSPQVATRIQRARGRPVLNLELDVAAPEVGVASAPAGARAPLLEARPGGGDVSGRAPTRGRWSSGRRRWRARRRRGRAPALSAFCRRLPVRFAAPPRNRSTPSCAWVCPCPTPAAPRLAPSAWSLASAVGVGLGDPSPLPSPPSKKAAYRRSRCVQLEAV